MRREVPVAVVAIAALAYWTLGSAPGARRFDAVLERCAALAASGSPVPLEEGGTAVLDRCTGRAGGFRDLGSDRFEVGADAFTRDGRRSYFVVIVGK